MSSHDRDLKEETDDTEPFSRSGPRKDSGPPPAPSSSFVNKHDSVFAFAEVNLEVKEAKELDEAAEEAAAAPPVVFNRGRGSLFHESSALEGWDRTEDR